MVTKKRESFVVSLHSRVDEEPLTLYENLVIGAQRYVNSRGGRYSLLILITLLAAVLRLYKLGEWSFWDDEVLTLWDSTDLSNINMNYPLYYVLANLSISWLGISEWSLRFPSAVAGIITVPALYFPIRRLFGHSVGLLTGLLIAVSPWHIYWSQNARFYVLMFLFYSLALLSFLLAVQLDKGRYAILSVFLLALAILSHWTALFLMPVVLLYLLLTVILPFEKPAGLKVRNVALFLGPCIIGAALLSFRVAKLWGRLNENFVVGGMQAPEFLRYTNTADRFIWDTVYLIGVPVFWLGLLGMVFLLVRRRHGGIFLLLAAVIPAFSLAPLASQLGVVTRYAFLALVGWFILAALAITELLGRERGTAKVTALVLFAIPLLIFLFGDVEYFTYQDGYRRDWKAAMEVVQRQRLPNDLVLASVPHLASYYLKDDVQFVRDLDPKFVAAQGRRVWIIVDTKAEWLEPELWQPFERRTRLVADFDFLLGREKYLLRVYLYDP